MTKDHYLFPALDRPADRDRPTASRKKQLPLFPPGINDMNGQNVIPAAGLGSGFEGYFLPPKTLPLQKYRAVLQNWADLPAKAGQNEAKFATSKILCCSGL